MRQRIQNWVENWTWGQTGVLVVLLVTGARLLGPVREPDLYWHLLMGYDITHFGRLTGNPDFTFGPHQAWETTQSGSEVLGYWWFTLFGLESFALLRVLGGLLVVGSIMWAAYKVAPRPTSRSLRYWTAALAGLVASAIPSVQERPQTISFILLPVVSLWLVRIVYTGRAPNIALVFSVTLVWTWLHGASLMIAPLLFGAWVLHVIAAKTGLLAGLGRVGPWWQSGPMVAAAAFLTTLLNPLGYRIYTQALVIADSASVGIVEWSKPFPTYPVMYLAMPTLFLLWLLAVGLLLRSSFPRKVFIVDALLIAPFLLYSETANRIVPVAVLLTIALVARRWVQAVQFSWRSPAPHVAGFLALPVAAVLAVGGSAFLALGLSHTKNLGGDAPVRIMSGLSDTSGERRVIGSYNIMGRLQLMNDARVVTAVDGRADRYSYDQLLDFIAMSRGDEGWDRTLDNSYPTATDYIDKAHSGVVPRLIERGWVERCQETDEDGSDWVWLTAPGVDGSCPAVASPLVPHIDR